MDNNTTKLISTLGIWIATAIILIQGSFTIVVPIVIVSLLVAGFSTAAIWNYKIPKMKK